MLGVRPSAGFDFSVRVLGGIRETLSSGGGIRSGVPAVVEKQVCGALVWRSALCFRTTNLLRGANLNLFRLLLCRFRKLHVQHTVFVAGFDRINIDFTWKTDDAME